MPGDLARVGAVGALARADRAVVLDQRRVEVERRLRTLEQRMDAGEELVERAVELAEMAEREAAQEAPERGRVRKPVAAEGLLGAVATQEVDVVETLASGDQRLAEGEDRLCRRIPASAALDRDPFEQLRQAESIGELAHEHESGMGGHLLAGRGDLDQRRSPC